MSDILSRPPTPKNSVAPAPFLNRREPTFHKDQNEKLHPGFSRRATQIRKNRNQTAGLRSAAGRSATTRAESKLQAALSSKDTNNKIEYIVNYHDHDRANDDYYDSRHGKPKTKVLLKQYYLKFSDHVSLELQRTMLITLVSILYLLLGGLIFSSLEEPDSIQKCSKGQENLQVEVKQMFNNIGKHYYENLLAYRMNNEELQLNEIFNILQHNITVLNDVKSMTGG